MVFDVWLFAYSYVRTPFVCLVSVEERKSVLGFLGLDSETAVSYQMETKTQKSIQSSARAASALNC